MPVIWQGFAAGTTLPPVGGGSIDLAKRGQSGWGPTLARNLRHYPPPCSLRIAIAKRRRFFKQRTARGARLHPSPPHRGGRVEPAARLQTNAPISCAIALPFGGGIARVRSTRSFNHTRRCVLGFDLS